MTGAGLIGEQLVDAPLTRGDLVTILDYLSTVRLSHHVADKHPNSRFFHGSVLDELMVDELMHASDVVVHLAAAAGVKLEVEQPLTSLATKARETADPGATDAGLVIAHTPRERLDLGRLSDDRLPLDASYRPAGTPRRVAL